MSGKRRLKSTHAQASLPRRRVNKAAQAETRRRVLDAIADARNGKPLSRAAKAAGTTVRTIRKYAFRLVERDERGHLAVKPTDRMKRPMRVLTPYGTIVLDIRNSRSASQLARYWNAVDEALRGRLAMLREFRGKAIRVDKIAYPYITDIRTLKRLAQAGEVQFEDLYDTTR